MLQPPLSIPHNAGLLLIKGREGEQMNTVSFWDPRHFRPVALLSLSRQISRQKMRHTRRLIRRVSIAILPPITTKQPPTFFFRHSRLFPHPDDNNNKRYNVLCRNSNKTSFLLFFQTAFVSCFAIM